MVRGKVRKFITFSVTYYKGTPFFKGVRVVTTPSRQHNVSLTALTVINVSIGSSIMLISSSKGLLTHKQALSRGVGGQILALLG